MSQSYKPSLIVASNRIDQLHLITIEYPAEYNNVAR